ncbi:cytochrome c oxidase assembly protein [Mycolicibacterium sp. 018/SC-01/001]|uniref:cytochrome c oxidase assembly protein n=1 Tax=Mycolicibacterium sp. 018/SC-01/001 TaxID=2592069 RepID=UPI00117F404F|nr:cytochrome c oxidase assembly protein [Mycolicibacterium sp. 018/SC-01/001]TRW82784.1 cytochrome c oxidase assembly protein [Mycolicibacterium sp. 018/SC-01/001]
MSAVTVPLTWSTALTSWQPNTTAAACALIGAAGYAWCYRRARPSLTTAHASCYAVAVALFVVATLSVVNVYSPVLFWMRAVQVLLLLMVIPFFLAMSRPVTALRAALSPARQDRLDAILAGRAPRLLLHPATTSVAMLALPWLFYLTPWYRAALRYPSVMEAAGALMLTVGFGYYYARLQTDPVPRRYTQLLSLVITIVESLGDGVLGIVLWLGPLIAAHYYRGLGRQWGPSMRVDQSIGAGVLWLVGDVLGVFFVLVLMRYFAADEKRHARIVDTELDTGVADVPQSGLWWENDPQLRYRMGRG